MGISRHPPGHGAIRLLNFQSRAAACARSTACLISPAHYRDRRRSDSRFDMGVLHLLGCGELAQVLQPKVNDMRGHGCKLPRLLPKAVEALVEEPTFARAAKRAGIARSTLFVWVKLPELRPLYDQIRRARRDPEFQAIRHSAA